MALVKDLVLDAQKGDALAFESIHERFKDMALSYAYSIIGDFELAEDARQEAFLEAYHDLLALRDPSAFPGWFKKIVFRRALALKKGDQTIIVPLEERRATASARAVAPERIQSDEVRGHINAAIDTLPPAEAETTRLFYMKGLHVKQVARKMRVSENTVKSRLRLARGRLQQSLMQTVKDEVSQMRRSGDKTFQEEASREAIRQFDRDLKSVSRRKRDEMAGRAVQLLCAKGRMLRFLGDCEEAIASFREGLDDLDAKELPLLASRLNAEIALTQCRIGQFDEARQSLSEARRLAKKDDDNLPLLPAILNIQGMCAWGRGDYTQARGYYGKALKACRGKACGMIKADSLNNLGLLDWKAGRLDRALGRLRQALAGFQKIAGRYESAVASCNLGIVEENMGRQAYAKRHYEKALGVAREISNREIEAATLTNLGNIAINQGDWAEALTCNQSAFDVALASGDERSQGIALENLALTQLGRGKAKDARKALGKARKTARKTKDEAQALSLDLVEVEARLFDGDSSGALEQLKQVRKTAEAKGYASEVPRILRLLAQARVLEGEIAKARRALDDAIRECRRQGNRPEEKRALAIGKPIGWRPQT